MFDSMQMLHLVVFWFFMDLIDMKPVSRDKFVSRSVSADYLYVCCWIFKKTEHFEDMSRKSKRRRRSKRRGRSSKRRRSKRRRSKKRRPCLVGGGGEEEACLGAPGEGEGVQVLTVWGFFHCEYQESYFYPVLRIRIHMFLGLRDPEPLVRSLDPNPDPALDPDPSIIMQK